MATSRQMKGRRVIRTVGREEDLAGRRASRENPKRES